MGRPTPEIFTDVVQSYRMLCMRHLHETPTHCTISAWPPENATFEKVAILTQSLQWCQVFQGQNFKKSQSRFCVTVLPLCICRTQADITKREFRLTFFGGT